MTGLLDRYDRIARLTPGLLMLLPAGITAFLLGLDEQPVISAVVSLAASVGLPFVLTRWVRTRGKDLEPQLWQSWGGPPTTQLLRDDPEADDRVLREHRRGWVAEAADVTLPGRTEEADDSAAADQRYEAAVRAVRSATRNRDDYPVVGHEVAVYGFWRNCLGVRPWALGVAGVSAVMAVAAVVFLGIPAANGVVAAALAVVWFWGWWQAVRPERVAQAAHRYAVHLLDSASTLTKR